MAAAASWSGAPGAKAPKAREAANEDAAWGVGEERTVGALITAGTAAHLEAVALLVGLDGQVTPLAEVDQHRAVRRLDLVPALAAVAQHLLERVELLVGEPQREHLAA